MKILLDNPNEFFLNHKEDVKETALYLILMTFIFTTLNELSIRLGFTKYIPTVDPLTSIAVNWISVVFGILIINFFISLFVKKFEKSLFIFIYSITPLLLLGWIPFAVVKTAVFLWSLFFFLIGLKIKANMPYKKALVIIFIAILIMIILILLSQNEILSIIPLQKG